MASDEGGNPFREPDPEARLRALREEERRLGAQLKTLAAELARVDRWSFGRFALGMILLPGTLVLLLAGLMLAKSC